MAEAAILTETRGRIGIITLNRPEILNAWDAPMRKQLVKALTDFDADPRIRAIILTGSGDRAFGAGQDLRETKTFDADRAEQWVAEWESLYSTIRSLSKPIVAALNGLAAGSAFQVALLCDIRIGHPGIRLGQPEINAGIASTLGPWIMRGIIGLARTTDLTLTGRLLDADEAFQFGLISRLVPEAEVMKVALQVAEELAEKPPIAMALNRRWFKDMTEVEFRACLEAGIRHQTESFASGEPQAMMEAFFEQRANK